MKNRKKNNLSLKNSLGKIEKNEKNKSTIVKFKNQKKKRINPLVKLNFQEVK